VGYYLDKTIPFEFERVGFYHALRRVEYMGVFFIAAAAVKSARDFKILLFSLISSIFLVNVYGLGQRFLDFPAIQTMNPEFAKGRILFLTPEARLSSTFAGHYDLSAFLVFLIPVLWGLYLVTDGWLVKKTSFMDPFRKLLRLSGRLLAKFFKTLPDRQSLHDFIDLQLDSSGWYLILFAGILAIILLAQAVLTYESVIALSLATFLIIFIVALRKRASITLFALMVLSVFILILTASRISFVAYIISTPALLWYLRRYSLAIFVVLLSFGLLMTNENLTKRFFQTFQIKQFLVNEQTGETHVVQEITGDDLPAGSQIVLKVNRNAPDTAQDKKLKQKILEQASDSAGFEFPQFTTPQLSISSKLDFTEVFGIAPDISFATRLQIEWPRAIAAFQINPWIGTGPSSITAATDNDYLRWLGETGLLGFLTFVFILVFISHHIFINIDRVPSKLRPLFYAPIFGLLGLMINASYIDVFEASKVAFIFWFVMGIYVGILQVSHGQETKKAV
ncbi:MAG: O-antigen ligase family protein, partial [Candidatus Paceibacterota bacterium]